MSESPCQWWIQTSASVRAYPPARLPFWPVCGRSTRRRCLPCLIPYPSPTASSPLTTGMALLISQWTGNAQINALLRGMYGLIDTELVQALKDLERMRNWDTAEGVWLDYIGRRLGFTRPTINVMVTRFGFSGGDGVGFNQAPFATATGFVPQVAVGDPIYLLCLKVWAGTILTSGCILDMNTAVRRSFPAAYYTDGMDSTIALVTGASGMQQTTAHLWRHPDGSGRLAPVACAPDNFVSHFRRGADGYMTTLQQYLRRCDLNIGGLLIQETLRIVFSIKLGGDASQQPSTVRIYNLAMATASNLIEAGTPVSLQAGYADTPLGPAV